jgi:hypothetical protein
MKRPLDDVILACKMVGCPWDPYPPIYVTQDRYGRRVWEGKIRCQNCGSVKYERYTPGDISQRVGSPRYHRPDGWYDVELRVYWGKARAERIKRGMITVADKPPTP